MFTPVYHFGVFRFSVFSACFLLLSFCFALAVSTDSRCYPEISTGLSRINILVLQGTWEIDVCVEKGWLAAFLLWTMTKGRGGRIWAPWGGEEGRVVVY